MAEPKQQRRELSLNMSFPTEVAGCPTRDCMLIGIGRVLHSAFHLLMLGQWNQQESPGGGVALYSHGKEGSTAGLRSAHWKAGEKGALGTGQGEPGGAPLVASLSGTLRV